MKSRTTLIGIVKKADTDNNTDRRTVRATDRQAGILTDGQLNYGLLGLPSRLQVTVVPKTAEMYDLACFIEFYTTYVMDCYDNLLH